MGRFTVILPAAGKSTRFGDPREKKIYADLEGRAVWQRAAEAFLGRDDVARVVIAIAAEDRELFERRYGAVTAFHQIVVVDGGAERADSIARALLEVDASCDFVAVHDAARPCVPREVVDRVFAAAIEHGAAAPGVAVADTLKRAGADGVIVETVPRAGLFGVQTPQAFRRALLVEAYAGRDRSSAAPTDDASLIEAMGRPVRLVEGSPMNLKITTQDDLRLARAILRSTPEPVKESLGHPFAEDRPGWADLPKIKPGDLFS